MVKILQTLFCSILLIPGFAIAKNMALTFDDLPANREVSVQELQSITNKILTGLDKHHIHAIGFVNEEKLHLGNDGKRAAILNRWIRHGNILGNHTYSHVSLHTTSLNEYKNQILSGEKVTRKLMENAGLTEQYFRHPYLHTGLTTESRNSLQSFLQNHQYQVAPVTYDTDDWQFDRLYVKAIKAGDNERAQIISSQYLEHTKNKFDFYDKATKTIFDRDINQIWLLHANSINADNIDSLINIAKDYGFSFIPLQEALKDEAYESDDNYYLDYGVSWLYRWDYSNGLKVDWKSEPEPVFSDSSTSIYSLERDYSRKIGVYVIDTNTGKIFSHRSNEQFPLQSTFKTFVAAHLLKKSEIAQGLLDKKIEFTEDDMVPWHPITGQHLPNGKMSLKDLACAAMIYSDNVATNLIMKELGGPQAITNFAASIGNKTFNVEHYEANLNSNPGKSKDISSPKDMAISLEKILLGDVLEKRNKELLWQWMLRNKSGGNRIRVALDKNTLVADKTGSGSFGVANDIGIIIPKNGKPIVAAIFTNSNKKNDKPDDNAISEATKIALKEVAYDAF